MAKKNKVTIEMGRAEDLTYWIALRSGKGESKYADGLSEGFVTEPGIAAQVAGRMVERFMLYNLDRISGVDNEPPYRGRA